MSGSGNYDSNLKGSKVYSKKYRFNYIVGYDSTYIKLVGNIDGIKFGICISSKQMLEEMMTGRYTEGIHIYREDDMVELRVYNGESTTTLFIKIPTDIMDKLYNEMTDIYDNMKKYDELHYYTHNGIIDDNGVEHDRYSELCSKFLEDLQSELIVDIDRIEIDY